MFVLIINYRHEGPACTVNYQVFCFLFAGVGKHFHFLGCGIPPDFQCPVKSAIILRKDGHDILIPLGKVAGLYPCRESHFWHYYGVDIDRNLNVIFFPAKAKRAAALTGKNILVGPNPFYLAMVIAAAQVAGISRKVKIADQAFLRNLCIGLTPKHWKKK